MKLAVSGSFSVGKTTLIQSLYKRFSEQSIQVQVVSEAARDCPLPINKKQSIESSAWIFGTQIQRESVAAAEHPAGVIICDRSSLDIFGFIDSPSAEIIKQPLFLAARAWLKTYDAIFFQTIDQDYPISNDGIRLLDVQYRSDVERRLKEAYCLSGINPVFLQGETNSRIDQILAFIGSSL